MFKVKVFVGILSILFSYSVLSAKKADNRPVAIIDNQVITYQQLFDQIEEPLYKAEMAVYELKLSQLKSILLERLIKAHPFSRGISPQDFLSQYVIKNLTVSLAEVEQFIKIKKIPAEKINAELKTNIKQYIKGEKTRLAIEKWFDVQAREHGVTINLVKPQKPTYQIPIGKAPVLGNADAPITIIEYSDFQCPYCAKAEATIKKLIKTYPGKIKLVYKNFPLGFHGEAFIAAEAGLCAKEQSESSFWKLHNEMFADHKGLKRPGLKSKAQKIGLNVANFEKCMDERHYQSDVNNDLAEGKKFGVSSTPMFFVNGLIVKGAQPFEVFAKIIDSELSKPK